MGSVVLTGDTSGAITVSAPAVAGTNTATIGAATGTHYPFTAGTAVASTSGTSIDFTSIPSWVKRITVMFNGVSTNGTSILKIRVGSGSIATTGYLGAASNLYSAVATANYTDGASIGTSNGASSVYRGIATLVNISGNSWIISGMLARSDTADQSVFNSSITLGGVLDQVRITTANGTDTFDAGSINILYE